MRQHHQIELEIVADLCERRVLEDLLEDHDLAGRREIEAAEEVVRQPRAGEGTPWDPLDRDGRPLVPVPTPEWKRPEIIWVRDWRLDRWRKHRRRRGPGPPWRPFGAGPRPPPRIEGSAGSGDSESAWTTLTDGAAGAVVSTSTEPESGSARYTWARRAAPSGCSRRMS